MSAPAHSDQPASYEGVLSRVRAMREQGDWPASTTPATQEQRRERVQQARRRIVYRPEPYEIAQEWVSERERVRWFLWVRWFLYSAAFALLAAAVFWGMVMNLAGPDVDCGPSYRDFSYPLPGPPPFLSEPLALAKAEESLAQVVRAATDWAPVQIPDSKIRLAPDGTRDAYLIRFAPNDPNGGMILFTNVQHFGETRTVSVQLEGAQVRCTVLNPR